MQKRGALNHICAVAAMEKEEDETVSFFSIDLCDRSDAIVDSHFLARGGVGITKAHGGRILFV